MLTDFPNALLSRSPSCEHYSRVDRNPADPFTAAMRLPFMLAITLLFSGCAGSRSSQSHVSSGGGAEGTNVSNKRLVVTPDTSLVGKVARVNVAGRFVVLNFPIGRMPLLEQRLNLYRHGLKVGEVRIAGPQDDDNIVADLLTGDAEVGDQARTK